MPITCLVPPEWSVLTVFPISQMRRLRLTDKKSQDLNPDLTGSYILEISVSYLLEAMCLDQSHHHPQPTPGDWNLSRIKTIWRLLV